MEGNKQVLKYLDIEQCASRYYMGHRTTLMKIKVYFDLNDNENKM